jgi:hypothetical protein
MPTVAAVLSEHHADWAAQLVMPRLATVLREHLTN